MKPLYIFDLDGTLALIDHRRHLVSGGNHDWKGFYAACVDDLPNYPVIEVMKALSETSDIWIFSGRSEEVYQETVRWLNEYCPYWGWLCMRKNLDYTPDDQLKLFWLESMLPEDRNRLVAVFDDRDKVVQMWRDNGITCFQVAPGDF